MRIDVDPIWRDHQHVDLRHWTYPVPSPRVSLLIQVLTVIKDLELGRLRLRSVVDLLRVIEAFGEAHRWRRHFDELDRQGLRLLGAVALELTLRLMEVRERHLGLAEVLDEITLPGIDRSSPTLGLAVFGLVPPAPGNKQILFPLHGRSTLASWAWWAASLPWRLRVYSV